MTVVGGRRGDTVGSPTVIGFAASAGALGRTAAICNVAWILAAAGRRVLIVDWSGDQIHTQDYLGPFQIGVYRFSELDDDQEDSFEPTAVLPGGGVDIGSPDIGDIEVTRYAVPVGSRQVDAISIAPPSYDAASADGSLSVDGWHERLRALPYDYVLVDAPVDVGWARADQVAGPCDVVAVCFLLRRRNIEQARELAQRMFRASIGGPRIVPVAVQVDDTDERRSQESRDAVRTEFRDLLDHANTVVGLPVELPYYPYDAYDQTLATLVDEPGDPTSVLAGYERLAAAITGGRVTRLAPVPPATRDRYRHRSDRPASQTATRITVVHAPVDRPWAEWVKIRLIQAGVDADRVLADESWTAPEIASVVAISSPAFIGTQAHEWLDNAATRQDDPLDVVNLVVAEPTETVGIGLRMPVLRADPPEGTTRIVIGHRTEANVIGQMYAHFGLFGPLVAPLTAPVRYPGRTARPVTNLPPSNPGFVGRDQELDTLRDRVLAGIGHLTVLGPAGIGKSEIVKEYAHRFAYDYDLVWWIPSHDRLAAEIGLGRLAARMGLETGNPVGALVEQLSTSRSAGRWLLIFDGVDDPNDIVGLLPAAEAGQVIITARVAAPADAEGVPVLAFRPAESTRLLLGRVPALSDVDAERVSDAVGRLPLPVWMASAWLGETSLALQRRGIVQAEAAHAAADAFLDRIDQIAPADLGVAEQDPNAVATARVLTMVLLDLAEFALGRITVGLAQMCAHLSPEGVSLRLLRSPAMLGQLWAGMAADTGTRATNAAELDAVLRVGERYGLFTVDWGRHTSLRMHRILQELLRGTITTPDKRAMWHGRLLAGLAGCAPTELELEFPESRGKFGELQKHLLVSGALDSDDEAVRRWVVNHTTYIYFHGDATTWQHTIVIAERVLARWQATCGVADRLTLRLQGQVANLARAVSRFQRALDLDENALAIQRSTLGLTHQETLFSTRGKAADLRAMGRFEEAYAADYEVYHGLRGQLGDDHPETLMAVNNLAISAFLTGETRLALALQQQHHDRCARLSGDDDTRTLVSTASVGVYLREVGRLSAAYRHLRDALDGLRTDRRPVDPTVLWVMWNLAIVDRRRGNGRAAQQQSRRVAAEYRQLFGDTAANTLGATLSQAADLHACGRSEQAVELAQRCLAEYRKANEHHPHNTICQMNLALYLRGANRMSDALSNSAAARTAFRAGLGETHPWSLLADANHATILAVAGDATEALDLAMATAEACRELLRDDHPYTRLAEVNVRRMRGVRSRIAGDGWREMDLDVLPN